MLVRGLYSLRCQTLIDLEVFERKIVGPEVSRKGRPKENNCQKYENYKCTKLSNTSPQLS
jgi:hypothetical protein